MALTPTAEFVAPRDAWSSGRVSGAAYGLSAALVLVAAVASAMTFFTPGVLRGPAVMNGSARGTALVVLVIAVPVVIGSMVWAARGSVRAPVVWLGGLAYLLYNAVLFLFFTPFNQLFLLYVAMLSLSIWSVIALIRRLDPHALRERFAPRFPARAIAGYVWAIATLNALAWLVRIVPAVGSSDPPSLLDGTGVSTHPVYVQDLAFWIPLMALSATLLWRRQPWGYVLVGAVLTFGVIESIGVAVDQWFGHAADPGSPVAGVVMVPVFAVLAGIGLVPLFFYFRNLDGHRSGRTPT
jgi:hypothetical protein